MEEKSCRIAAYFFIHSLFYEKFNDVLRHQVQKIICTDFDRKKRKAVVFGFFGVGNGNVKYFLTVPFFFFTPERERKSWTPTRESAAFLMAATSDSEMISGIFAV